MTTDNAVKDWAAPKRLFIQNGGGNYVFKERGKPDDFEYALVDPDREATVAGLVEALKGLTLPKEDGDCWCVVPGEADEPHESQCIAARSALAAYEGSERRNHATISGRANQPQPVSH